MNLCCWSCDRPCGFGAVCNDLKRKGDTVEMERVAGTAKARTRVGLRPDRFKEAAKRLDIEGQRSDVTAVTF